MRAGPSNSPSAWDGPRRVAGREDVQRILAEVTNAGLHRGNTALAHRLVQTVDTAALETPDAARVLPVMAELAAGLLPWPGGIRRGATVSVRGSTSLVLALLSEAMRQGSWAAVCGMPNLGLLAAGEDYRLDLARLALVPAPGPDWPAVVSALIDGLDAVVVSAPGPVADSTARSLMARARQKDCVLLPVGAPWPGSDLAIEVTARSWSGLGVGRGRLKRQQLTVQAAGKGRAARPRTAAVTLPPHQAELHLLQHSTERRHS
ncbi:hypothetical protein [Actinoplanes sp. NPDC049316]|uniref:hypothetical protein n=1 Tax=Actinoplanes sp. NPDC049316 TaxID=3154727 RepID=UPI00342B0147